jgi:uncharacterized protein with HEPN domain
MDLILEYTANLSADQFKTDRKTRDAVLMYLIVIGEAANKLPDEFKKKHGTVEWAQIIRSRNIITHEYGRVDYDVIWRIATLYLPATKAAITKIYRAQ